MFYWKFASCKDEFQEFVKGITKIFEVYYILYKKVIKEVKNFTNTIIEAIVRSTKNDKKKAKEINTQIENYLNNALKLKKNKEDDKTMFETILNESLDTWCAKKVMCMIIAKDAEKNRKGLKELFIKKFDIEHICAQESEGEELEKEKRNNIGNLMILEYSINRGIKNEKIEKKLNKYNKSGFKVVENIAKGIAEGIKEQKEYKECFKTNNEESIKKIKKYFGIKNN